MRIILLAMSIGLFACATGRLTLNGRGEVVAQEPHGMSSVTLVTVDGRNFEVEAANEEWAKGWVQFARAPPPPPPSQGRVCNNLQSRQLRYPLLFR